MDEYDTFVQDTTGSNSVLLVVFFLGFLSGMFFLFVLCWWCCDAQKSLFCGRPNKN